MKLMPMLLIPALAVSGSLDSALPVLAGSTPLATSRDKQETRKADEAFKDALAKAKDSKLKVFLTFGSPG